MPNANEPRFPTHVAIIVDGNRRWAKQRMLPVSVGHKAGFDRLREITRYAVGDRGVFVLSLYVFSTENFSRDAKLHRRAGGQGAVPGRCASGGLSARAGLPLRPAAAHAALRLL